MRWLRQSVRLPLVFLHVLLGGGIILLAVYWDRWRGNPRETGAGRRAQALWSGLLCRLLGLRVVVEGEPLAPGPVLLVSNHITWLDIPVVAAFWPVDFLSKSEVRGWPIIGPVATGLGTIYIERGRRDAAGEAAALMRERLALGRKVLFFPEGTTSDGTRLRPFRPRLYQSAVDAGVPVQTLAISYHYPDSSLSDAVPYINDDTLIGNLLAVAAVPRHEVRLRVGAVIPVRDRGRTEVAQQSWRHIAGLLDHLQLEQAG